MAYVGEIAALAAATCWAFGTILFGEASRRVGAFTTNTLRIPFAALLLMAALLVTHGAIWPTWATPTQVGLLALSSLIGLVAGDSLYFRCVVLVGPRKASLAGTLVPPLAAIFAWIVLDEALGVVAAAGMLVTLIGVAWVVVEGIRENRLKHTRYLPGIMYGLGAAAGQASGLVIAKLGMGQTLDALSATLIRVLTGALSIWALAIVAGHARPSMRALRDSRALLFVGGGSFVGPFLGIWLMLLSIKHAETGVASTLMVTTPIVIIPLVRIIYSEKATARAWLGTLVAVVGIALLFVR